jgi:dTDP-4-dehydrorhamnose 3,5-epimerase
VIFSDTSIPGAYLVHPEPTADERGFFARTWSRQEFEAHGLVAALDHVSVSWNRRRGTLRGMHLQGAPFEEVKLVSCLRGAVHDVIVDLRPGSPTLHQWFAARLDSSGMRALYIPAGVAHGFLTLEDDSLVQYAIRGRFSPEHARGLRHDDPKLAIAWPEAAVTINERDQSWPLLEGEAR